MQRQCVQCGKEFTITTSEIKFYKSKNLALPKRCKECRQQNRSAAGQNAAKQTVGTPAQTEAPGKKSAKKKSPFVVALTVIAILVAGLFYWQGSKPSQPAEGESDTVSLSEKASEASSSGNEFYSHISDLGDVSEEPTVGFKNKKLFDEHYSKHSSDTGSSSNEEYLKKANDLIKNPKALFKITKDGDTAYFLSDTNEFAIVSANGILRTYFVCSGYDYFERQ